MQLVEIYRYPVKSLGGHAVTDARVEPIGLAGDRRWLVVDPAGMFQTIRENPAMMHVAVDHQAAGILLRHPDQGALFVPVPEASAATQRVTVWRDSLDAVVADAAAGDYLSRVMGSPVQLVYLADPEARPVDPVFAGPEDHVSFADGFPLLLTTSSSLDDLNQRLDAPVDMRRFRPNLVIEGAEAWAEDGWREIRVGQVRFRIAKPCARCVITTYDPDTGRQPNPKEPLKTLARFHRAANGGAIFGQNLIPLDAGAIRVGDAVEVLAEGPSNLL